MPLSPTSRLLAFVAFCSLMLAAPPGLRAESGRAVTRHEATTIAHEPVRYALLIGVMGYPNLRERDRLAGPGNDVALAADYLRDVEGMAGANITILLDDGVHPPATLAAIRTEMAGLAARVGPGDFVYLHFSGHGTQAPAPPGSDEADGLDELFLPYDVGAWNGDTGVVENALVDDEIGQMLDAIRARGADVWAVFDACNSGTVTRGADEVRLRRVAPEVLGVPMPNDLDRAAIYAPPEAPFDTGQTDRRVPDTGATGGGQTYGRLTAFFAARADQSTPEMNLPRGAPDRRPQGLFSYTILSELAAHPGQSYADLGAAVLTRYATEGLAPQTEPLFEGALETAALKGGGVAPVAAPDTLPLWPLRWSDDIATLPAGSLHGLRVGDRLDLVKPDGIGVLGQLEVRAVTPLSAQTISAAQGLFDGTFARPMAASVPVDVTLAMPQIGQGPGALPASAVLALFDGISGAIPGLQGRLAPVPAGQMADLRLVIEDGRVVIVPGAGMDIDTVAPGFPLGTDPRATGTLLAPLILLEARALLLTRAAAALPARLPGVMTELSVTPNGATVATPLDPATLPDLAPGDVVTLALHNNRAAPVDIDVLYIAADHTIQHLRQIRLRPGDASAAPLFRVLPGGFGREMLLVVQREVAADAAPEPLTFLATGAAPAALRTGTQSDGPSLTRFLADAGFGTGTRGPAADSAGAAAILIVPVVTRPHG